MRNGWIGIGLVACFGCVPEIRQLSTKEALIPVFPSDDPQVTAQLAPNCRVLGTVRDAPTAADRSLGTAFAVAFGERYLCQPGIADLDDVRRCAGEHQAQVVQIVGRKTETTDDTWRIIALSIANGVAAGLTYNTALSYTTQQNALMLDQWAQNAVRTRTLALDLRLWRCPASRAIPAQGELVWRREKANRAVDLLQDGQVVGNAQDLDRLPQLVAAHPPALSLANEAVAHESSMYTKMWIGAPLGVLAIGGLAVGLVGLLKDNYPLGIGGVAGGVVLSSVSIPIMMSAVSSSRRAQTSAMNAVDAWNDDYIHRRGASPAQGESVEPPVALAPPPHR
jgi:hypothetical protein